MKFSVVIPTYNGEKYIEQTIESVLNQECPFDEIIVSDDNSIDKTLDICGKYADKIKIFQNKKGPSGFVNGWNNAIEKASCDYISILHQDDLLDISFLSSAKPILEKNPDILHFFTPCGYIDETVRTTRYSYEGEGEIRRYSGLEYLKAYQTIGDPHIHRCPGVITHRSIFEKCKYNSAAGHIADDDFFYRVGLYTDVIGLLTPLASYRHHTISETGKLDNAILAKNLFNDYRYQLKQWENNNFLDKEAFHYFIDMKHKYIKRYLGHGLKEKNLSMIFYALKNLVG